MPSLAAAVAQSGVKVDILGVRDPRAPEAWRNWRAPGVEVHALKQRGPSAFGWAPSMSRTLTELGPDFVHAQGLWQYPSLATLAWHRRTRRPYLVAPRGMLDPWALGRGRLKKAGAAWWFENERLQRAACLHALNEAEARAFRGCGLRNPICIVPNGVDLPEEQARRCDPEHRRTLLFLGRIDPKKGVEELLLAWAEAAPEAVAMGWHLRLVGWGDRLYVERIQALIAERGLERSVALTGPAFGQDKEAAFRDADAFILPSFSEGLPMAVLEAWSHRLPVLMTSHCNLPEGFTAGAAIEIGTAPTTIVPVLRYLFALSATERTTMGAKGRHLVETRFTWPQVGRMMVAVYRWLIQGGAMPAWVRAD